jgi:nucleoside-triphosphatase
MSQEPVRILLTGPPGCGKTTAVKRIVEALDKAGIAGFYTEEIREAGVRQGFRWHRLDGQTGILAHVHIESPLRVSKYGVDIRGFEEHIIPLLDPNRAGVSLFAIDEIGKMECFSEKFIEAVRRLLASGRPVLATVAQKGSGFIREAKACPAVRLLHLTRENRDGVTQDVIDRLRQLPGM